LPLSEPDSLLPKQKALVESGHVQGLQLGAWRGYKPPLCKRGFMTIANLPENSLNLGRSLSDHTTFDQSGTAPLTVEIGLSYGCPVQAIVQAYGLDEPTVKDHH
jgi:hypothetical protein